MQAKLHHLPHWIPPSGYAPPAGHSTLRHLEIRLSESECSIVDCTHFLVRISLLIFTVQFHGWLQPPHQSIVAKYENVHGDWLSALHVLSTRSRIAGVRSEHIAEQKFRAQEV